MCHVHDVLSLAIIPVFWKQVQAEGKQAACHLRATFQQVLHLLEEGRRLHMLVCTAGSKKTATTPRDPSRALKSTPWLSKISWTIRKMNAVSPFYSHIPLRLRLPPNMTVLPPNARTPPHQYTAGSKKTATTPRDPSKALKSTPWLSKISWTIRKWMPCHHSTPIYHSGCVSRPTLRSRRQMPARHHASTDEGNARAHIAYTTKDAPDYRDSFFQVCDLIDAWNDNMDCNLHPSWVVIIDKSMSVWTNVYLPWFHVCSQKTTALW
jgi:hypothetical protein